MTTHRDNIAKELKNYFKLKHIKRYIKGEMILHQDEPSYYVYFVRSGFVRIYDIDKRGNQKLVMILGEVNLFPISAIIRPNLVTGYYWEAMTDVEICIVEVVQFRSDIMSNPALCFELFTHVAGEFSILDGRIWTLLQTYAAQRIPSTIKYLVDYAGHIDKQGIGHLELIISHQDVAALTNVARETASIELKKLKDEKIIWYEGHKMLINLAKLEDMM